MALTNPRPLQIPALQNEILHNTASPVFQASSLVLNPKHEEDMFPNTPSSEGSPSDHGKSKKEGSVGSPKKDTLTLEISKIIPVTGERPMPKERTAPLDDDVLYAVFVILWEEDPELQGMTVKQLSDHLLEKHPEMSNLSTKLSNLISAKLNAYVKKLEKGEKTLTYALSREWSNSSPRRMVYVYRGILSPDYKKHAQAAAVHLKQQQSVNINDTAGESHINPKKGNGGFLDPVAGNGKIGTASNLGFSLSPEFNIPYAASPVSAILTPASTGSDKEATINSSVKRAHSDDEEEGSVVTEQSKKIKSNNGDYKGDFSRTESAPNTTYITAAAAAPRLSKSSPKNNFNGVPQNSAAIVAAIHKLFSTQTPIESRPKTASSDSNLTSLPGQSSEAGSVDSWVKTVREGFLAHDIDSPETISFEELDCILDQ